MNFVDALKAYAYLLYDGPMETRIQFNTSIKIPEDAAIYQLVSDAESSKALAKFYKMDIEAALAFNLPIILNAPTWRASTAHLHNKQDDVAKINHDCVQFVLNIKNKFADNQNIYITAPIGPELTDYAIDSSKTIEDHYQYHLGEANALAASRKDIDIVSIASMWNLTEAAGAAKAVAETSLPYSVGFVLTADGTLLDGSSVKDLIETIDHHVFPNPLFYVLSCTHPSHALTLVHPYDSVYERIKGIKANGSAKPLNELLQSGSPLADPPGEFAKDVMDVASMLNLKVIGGCCGTDTNHLLALAKAISMQESKREINE